jgi:hypothetical protein
MSADVSELLAAMRSLATELIATIEAVPGERLAATVGELQRVQNLVTAAATALASEVDRRGVWAEDGFRSAGRWLSFHSGESATSCSRRVGHARQLSEMPTTLQLTHHGLLTADQLRPLLHAQAGAPEHYDPEIDAALATLATSSSPAELARAVRAFKERAEAETLPDPAAPTAAETAQHLHLHPTFDGWWDGSFRLSPDDGTMLDTLVDGEVDGYLRAARDGDPSLQGLAMGALRAKALIDLVTRAARRAPGEVSAPDRYRVAVVIPADADVIPAAACDADLYRLVISADGEPLDVGRTTRRWTTAIRRAITHRDGVCTFPGCDRPPAHCDIHHCTPWSHGGKTATSTGILLCRHHHTFLHDHGWQVHLDDRQRPVFLRPDGTRHDPRSERPRSSNGALCPPRHDRAPERAATAPPHGRLGQPADQAGRSGRSGHREGQRERERERPRAGGRGRDGGAVAGSHGAAPVGVAPPGPG